MEAMAPAPATKSPSPADACPCGTGVSTSSGVEEVLPCDTAASAMRRKRIEIRRIRILANSGDGLLKRSRISQLRDSGNKKSRELLHTQQQQQIVAPGSDHQLELLPPLLSSGSSGSSTSSSEELELACGSLGRDGCPAFGSISVCGRRREMEDAVKVETDFSTLPCTLSGCLLCSRATSVNTSSLHFFGVYDGHGGSQAATFCQQRLHAVLEGEVRELSGSSQCPGDPAKFWEDAMTRCFLKVDEQVRRPVCSGEDCPACNGNGCDEVHIPETVGSTAVVAVVSPGHLVIANCGDCRAVLSRGGRAIQLSTDHKAGRPDETARIEAAGGQVINWDIPRILGILAMSRSIGDQYMTPYLIPNPEVKCITRSDSDECLILASDGLWDKVSNEAACEIARRCIAGRRMRDGASAAGGRGSPVAASAAAGSTSPPLDRHHHQQQQQQQEGDSPCSAAASLLLKVAMRNGSKDNISVVVIDLKRHREREGPAAV